MPREKAPALNVARRRYWKILVDTGDDINNSWDEKAVMNCSLEELLKDADYMMDNHANSMYGEDFRYEQSSYRKYKRFIERFSK